MRIVSERMAVAHTGEKVPVEADTICLHGDNPGAVQIASALHTAFQTAGVGLVPLNQLV